MKHKVLSRENITDFVGSNGELVDMFIKSLRKTQVKSICNKLDAYDIYAPSWWEVLEC